MNSPEDTAPLRLLSKINVLELADIIGASTASNSEITLTPLGPTNNRAFEVVYCGVTFTISVTHENYALSGLKEIFCNFDPAHVQSRINIALGPHVAGGERVPAIVRTLLDVALKMGVASSAVATIWRPANIVSGFAYFEEAVDSYLSGGAFPVLAMINFKTGADGIITTTGLATFSGQELQIDCGMMDNAEIMRRAVRVSHDLAVNGPILSKTTVEGLSQGEKLDLDPDYDGMRLNMKSFSILDA